MFEHYKIDSVIMLHCIYCLIIHVYSFTFYIDILKDSIKPYNEEDSERFKTVVAFECRGIEPVDFSPRVSLVLKVFLSQRLVAALFSLHSLFNSCILRAVIMILSIA